VKTMRQLQKIGAVAVKNSVYALPFGDEALEGFSWIARQIAAGGGDSSLCESSFVGGSSNDAIEALFNRSRGRDYQVLEGEIRAAIEELGKARHLDEGKRSIGEAALARLRRRHSEIARLDFFAAADGEKAVLALAALERRLRGPAVAPRDTGQQPLSIRGGVWVTRRGVHVDRIASAWLIKRFIDPKAKLKFVTPKGYVPRQGELRFDMFEAEHTHEGDRCTFEVLARRFGVSDPAVTAIGEVVHDIDLRDGKFGRLETPGVERLITGLALTVTEDAARIALGAKLFDALYEAWRRRKT
jgi:hypothetical protein